MNQNLPDILSTIHQTLAAAAAETKDPRLRVAASWFSTIAAYPFAIRGYVIAAQMDLYTIGLHNPWETIREVLRAANENSHSNGNQPACRRYLGSTPQMELTVSLLASDACRLLVTGATLANAVPTDRGQAVLELLETWGTTPEQWPFADNPQSKHVHAPPMLIRPERYIAAIRFLSWVLTNGSWAGADIDGGAAQDEALRLGLIEPYNASGPCGASCGCADAGVEFPAQCYRLALDIRDV